MAFTHKQDWRVIIHTKTARLGVLYEMSVH
jgi:hypothetical protein